MKKLLLLAILLCSCTQTPTIPPRTPLKGSIECIKDAKLHLTASQMRNELDPKLTSLSMEEFIKWYNETYYMKWPCVQNQCIVANCTHGKCNLEVKCQECLHYKP